MKDSPEAIQGVKIGDIMQIGPGEAHGTRLQLITVTDIETWGIRGDLTNGGNVGRPWDLVEPTGGRAVFDKNGVRLEPPKPIVKHHV